MLCCYAGSFPFLKRMFVSRKSVTMFLFARAGGGQVGDTENRTEYSPSWV